MTGKAALTLVFGGGRRMQGRSLTITFAEPRFLEQQQQQGGASGGGEVKSVFVGKLPESATEEKLQTIFSGFGEIEKVLISELASRAGFVSSGMSSPLATMWYMARPLFTSSAA